MRRIMTIRIAAISLVMTLALLSVTVSISFAKCGLEPYVINGRVIEEKTKNAIGDAKIFLFFDSYDGTWSAGYDTKYPDYFKTNESGEFEATMFFDRYSGWSIFTGDRCNARPKTVTVVVTAEGYLTKRWEFETKELEIKGEPFKRTILLPAIELRLPRVP